jgi:hypothetical protein
VILDVTRHGIDRVGVWGSNPHAPTNPLNKLPRNSPLNKDTLNSGRESVVIAADGAALDLPIDDGCSSR